MQLKMGMPKDLQEKISFTSKVGSVKMNKIFKSLSPDARRFGETIKFREMKADTKYLPFSKYYGQKNFLEKMTEKFNTKSPVSDYFGDFVKQFGERALKAENCKRPATQR